MGISPLMDAGTNNGCPLTDERVLAHPINGHRHCTAGCGIGAHEAVPITRMYLRIVIR